MSLPTLAAQAWRVIRVGGVAALAATQAAPHVSTSGSKAALIAGIVAAVVFLAVTILLMWML